MTPRVISPQGMVVVKEMCQGVIICLYLLIQNKLLIQRKEKKKENKY